MLYLIDFHASQCRTAGGRRRAAQAVGAADEQMLVEVPGKVVHAARSQLHETAAPLNTAAAGIGVAV